MRTRGAVLRQAPGKWEIMELEVDDPRDQEVQVRVVASGLCHSDDHVATGDFPVATYPMAGGHEGAGVVVKAGSNSKGIVEGDHVVFSFIPSCGYCRWCASGMQNLCDLGARILAGTRMSDPDTYALGLLDGTPVGQICGISTFVETTTVSVNSVVKVDKDVPLDRVCLTGCSVGTGWGSAVNAAEVRPGHTVIVMGIGGIGANAVQGARHAGASNVIAVDPIGFKREQAEELGATHSAVDMDAAAELARSMTNGQGADSAIVAVGVTTGEHIAQAFAAIRKAGIAVVTGVGNAGEIGIPISPFELAMMQKQLRGALFGQSNPNWDIPRQIQLYRDGVLKLDELVTRTYRLEEIEQGFEDMRDGKNIRGVVLFE